MSEHQPLNILIVEDDEAAAHLIRKNLDRSGLGAVCFRAKDGENALKILNGQTVEELDHKIIPEGERLLVLMDIRMPKMDGIQALQVMKNDPKLKRVPVVMLTTSDQRFEIQQCYDLGCNLYLKKNVDYTLFVESIQKMAAFIAVCEIPAFGGEPLHE